jgi:hypothetical protein
MDLAEVVTWPETTRTKLAMCARSMQRRTMTTRPCHRRQGLGRGAQETEGVGAKLLVQANLARVVEWRATIGHGRTRP